MTEPIYVFQCPNCDEFTDSDKLVCASCGESVKRSWVETITDGAPTGAEDPEWVKGFRVGQEYGISIERERIIKSLVESQCVNTSPYWRWSGTDFVITLGNLSALIKGEQK